MKRNRGQALMLPDDVNRAWAFSFFGINDLEQGNIMCAGARRELRLRGYMSNSEVNAVKMKYPHLTTYDK